MARRKLAEWMKAQGWHQGQLAEALSVSRSLVSRLLSGDNVPGIALAERIEKLTGIATREWLTSEERAQLDRVRRPRSRKAA